MLTRRQIIEAGLKGGAAAATLSWAPASLAADPAAEGRRLHAFLEAAFEAAAGRRPETLARLGRGHELTTWNDESDAFDAAEQKIVQEELARLRREFDPNALSETDRLSYRLFEWQAEQSADNFRWRFHDYPVSHLRGVHTDVPSFLVNQHRISSPAEARGYIGRIAQARTKIEQVIAAVDARAAKGVLPPRWSLAKAREDAAVLLAGSPFEPGAEDTALLADFRAKVAKLDVPAAERAQLEADCVAALRHSLGPAYRGFIEAVTGWEAKATDEDGVWKLPQGAEFYRHCIRRNTTLDLAAEEVHAYGLSEVARIHAEMNAIRGKVGFQGDLAAFFVFLRDDPRFLFPNTDEGRAAYIAESQKVIDAMAPRLPEMFVTLPKAPVVIKRVEPFRERTSPGAFYNGPTPDGSKPGTYFINLFNTKDRPRHGIEALVHHEAIPGHHMQIAIATEMKDLPSFRRFGGYSAFSEGWALYSEKMVKPFGFYADPYSDYGRLEAELFRSIRLVVDTGIHAFRWGRQQAIDYMTANSAITPTRAVREIERYIVNPGQALAYKTGMRKIEELRARSEQKLGSRFDLRRFHDAVLTGGSVPLPILEDRIDGWIASHTA
ncbi:MAG TPA: DUF885 domain-containing protein [Azospirillaceae bacterium]|nr:DUF885 domain-containing protein [Azospirillaceae bacterium]